MGGADHGLALIAWSVPGSEVARRGTGRGRHSLGKGVGSAGHGTFALGRCGHVGWEDAGWGYLERTGEQDVVAQGMSWWQVVCSWQRVWSVAEPAPASDPWLARGLLTELFRTGLCPQGGSGAGQQGSEAGREQPGMLTFHNSPFQGLDSRLF